MALLELTDDKVRINADLLCKAFGIGSEDLKREMRNGRITSRFEQGLDEDSGTVRLTFFSPERRIRMVVDDAGNVLTCSAVDLAGRASQVSQVGDQPENAGNTGRDDNDGLLDVALQGTFPASDPVAVSFDPSKPTVDD